MKFIVKFAVFIVVIAIAVVAGVTFYIDSIAKKAIEYGGTEALGVATTVNGVNISLLSGSSKIDGFTIANPPNFNADNFMKLNHAKITIDMDTITSDTIHIAGISIGGLHLNLEQSSNKSNVKEILSHLPKTTPQDKTTTSTSSTETSNQPPATSGMDKKFVVDKIVLSDIGVTAQIEALGAKLSEINLNLAKIQLNNIGQQQGGMTMPELISTIVEQIIDAVANNSGAISPELARMLQGDLTSVEGITKELKAGAKDAAAEEVNKQASKLLNDLDIADEDRADLQQAADNLFKGIFDDKK